MKKIKVTVWNEYLHELQSEEIAAIYPEGIHGCIAGFLQAAGMETRTATLRQVDNGLPQDVLDATDVLVWWGHLAHGQVSDEVVDRVQRHVLQGMGLVVLHSGHFSKIFRRMMGTACRLRWREAGEKERLWVVAPSHPIAQGIPETFVIPHHEMYGEPFDIPQDGKIIFQSWFEGGNVFRSGVAFERDRGKVFYFSPGHETFPVYHDPVIQQILGNAVRWAAPSGYVPDRITRQPVSPETIRTENPLKSLDTTALHKS